jgi:hypothetical protein
LKKKQEKAKAEREKKSGGTKKAEGENGKEVELVVSREAGWHLWGDGSKVTPW